MNKEILQKIKEVGAVYQSVIDRIIDAQSINDNSRAAFFLKIENGLNALNINRKKSIGMYSCDPCKLGVTSRGCEDCTGYYKKNPEGHAKNYSMAKRKGKKSTRCFIKDLLFPDEKHGKKGKNFSLFYTHNSHQNAHPYKSLFDSLREY